MITKKIFGKTATGEDVSIFRMTNSKGEYVDVLDYGCTIVSLCVRDKNGVLTDVCLGYNTVAEYENNGGYLGSIIGRHSNRLADAKFTLNGTEYNLAKNDGANHLHGGTKGYDKYVWDSKIDGEKLIFTRVSADGEDNYPGKVDLVATYTFDDNSALSLDYVGVSDKDTLLNITNHSYFNLNGVGTIENHHLKLGADFYTENGDGCMPNGVIASVTGTPMDFTAGRRIGEDLHTDWQQMSAVGGYDHNFVLRDTSEVKCAGVLWSSQSGIAMEVLTTKPAMQIYTANALGDCDGKMGQKYGKHSGVCMETQFYPNSMQYSHFPCIVLKAGATYHHCTTYKFSVK